MDNLKPVPKIMAAAIAASVIIAITAISRLIGIDLVNESKEVLVLIIAALVPVLTGWFKSSNE